MPKLFKESSCEILVEAYGWEKSGKGKGASAERGLHSLRKMLVPFVLRRMKIHVLDQLVPKTTEVIQVTLQATEQAVYDGVLSGYAERKNRMKTGSYGGTFIFYEVGRSKILE